MCQECGSVLRQAGGAANATDTSTRRPPVMVTTGMEGAGGAGTGAVDGNRPTPHHHRPHHAAAPPPPPHTDGGQHPPRPGPPCVWTWEGLAGPVCRRNPRDGHRNGNNTPPRFAISRWRSWTGALPSPPEAGSLHPPSLRTRPATSSSASTACIPSRACGHGPWFSSACCTPRADCTGVTRPMLRIPPFPCGAGDAGGRVLSVQPAQHPDALPEQGLQPAGVRHMPPTGGRVVVVRAGGWRT